MKTLVSAAIASPLESGSVPRTIVFLPEGRHDITATVNGKPGTVTVNVPPERGPEIAAKLQAALSARLGENVRPHFGYDHKPGAASGLPQALRYEPGLGIVVDVEWTGSGRAGIEGRDFSYFSPVFYRDEDGLPSGLPSKGELGSLVNSPAFRGIQRIAASDAGGEADRFYRKIAADAGFGEAADEEEAKAWLAEYGPDGNQTSEGREKKKVLEAEEAERELKKRGEQQVAAGHAGTLEEGMMIAASADDSLYAAAYSGFAARGPHHAATGAVVAAAHAGASAFEAKAQTLVQAGQAATLDDAMSIITESDPAAYSDYLKTLH